MSGSWEDYYFTGRSVGTNPNQRPMFESERRVRDQQDSQQNTGNYYPTMRDDYGVIHGASPNQDALGAARMDENDTYMQFRRALEPLQQQLLFSFMDGGNADAITQQIREMANRPPYAQYAPEVENWLKDWNHTQASRNFSPRWEQPDLPPGETAFKGSRYK